jgi:hypothetical protein
MQIAESKCQKCVRVEFAHKRKFNNLPGQWMTAKTTKNVADPTNSAQIERIL